MYFSLERDVAVLKADPVVYCAHARAIVRYQQQLPGVTWYVVESQLQS